jgi:hypothetical protein
VSYSWLDHFTFTDPRFTEVGDFVERDEEIATIETDKVGINPIFTMSSSSYR